MNDEMRQDSVDIVITACEKFQGDYEVMQPAPPRLGTMSLSAVRGANGVS